MQPKIDRTVFDTAPYLEMAQKLKKTDSQSLIKLQPIGSQLVGRDKRKQSMDSYFGGMSSRESACFDAIKTEISLPKLKSKQQLAKLPYELKPLTEKLAGDHNLIYMKLHKQEERCRSELSKVIKESERNVCSVKQGKTLCSTIRNLILPENERDKNPYDEKLTKKESQQIEQEFMEHYKKFAQDTLEGNPARQLVEKGFNSDSTLPIFHSKRLVSNLNYYLDMQAM